MRDLMGEIFAGGDFLKPGETILDFPYEIIWFLMV